MGFSDTIIQVWNEWEIRALLILSLSLQVILTTLGSVRKHSTSTWIRLVVWSAYMSAGMVASVALGILARDITGGNVSVNSIQALWTPFLILHLGGPDTITAYSLEDNELWPRKFLDIFLQFGVAVYVTLKVMPNTQKSLLRWIVGAIFISATKFVENGFVLMRTHYLRNFLFSDPDPGPDYPEALIKKRMGANLESSPSPRPPPHQRYLGSPDNYLSQSFYLFNRLTYLFADLILGYNEREVCHSMISSKSSEEAFELVEGELGLLYDALYTKLAHLHYKIEGYRHRVFTFFASIFSLVLFMNFKDPKSSPPDISVTYLLLIGAVVLEVYGFVVLMRSDWTKLWLLRYAEVTHLRIGKRWSRKISKFDLIKFCLRKQNGDTMWIKLQNILGIEETLAKSLNVEYQDVDADLKSFIFQQLKERSEDIINLFDVNSCKKVLSYRGDCVLDKMGCLELLKWSTIEVDFDHSLLLWHIATQLCYYDDAKRLRGSNSLRNLDKYSKISKELSDYMMYLLVMYPNMLPKGIGEIRYKDTCAEATRFFKQRRDRVGTKVDEACNELYDVETDSLEELKGDATKSILFYGSRLAQRLQALEFETKWDMVNKFWVELLAYAAVHCGWKEHGQQLRRGGELLTHVCVLMAHLGLSEQYQIQKEYFRIHEDKPAGKLQAACQPFLKRLAAWVFALQKKCE